MLQRVIRLSLCKNSSSVVFCYEKVLFKICINNRLLLSYHFIHCSVGITEHSSLHSYDYEGCLRRLSTTYTNSELVACELEQMPQLCTEIVRTLNPPPMVLHAYSNGVLERYCPSIYSTYRAFTVSPNGSCLFNSASVLLVG
jgi:hypothetical protein